VTDGIKIGDLVVWRDTKPDYKKDVGIILDENHRYYYIKWSDKRTLMMATNKDLVIPARIKNRGC